MTAVMHRFDVLAASAIDASRRIRRTIKAWSELHAMRIASRELHDLNYYVVDVRELRDGETTAYHADAPARPELSGHPVPTGSVYDDMI